MASTPLASSLSSAGGGVPRRRVRADSDNEMLRELIKVVCECLYRTRSAPRPSTNPSNSAERPRKTKWFGIVSDRVPEVERQIAEWTPHMTTIVNISADSVLLESWSIRYTLNTVEGRGRVYSKLMVFVRSLLVTTQALPASRNRAKSEIQIRLVETDDEPYDVVPPLPEQFCFPSIDLAFGRIDMQVRYRNDVPDVLPNASSASNASSLQRKTSATLFEPSIVEDYIRGGRSSSNGGGDGEVDEDEAENRRWRRWASESFDERERELAERKTVSLTSSSSAAAAAAALAAVGKGDPRRVKRRDEEDEDEDDDDEEEDIPGPPSNTRASSNPMAIPGKNVDHHHHHGASGGAASLQKRTYDRSEANHAHSRSRASNPSPSSEDAGPASAPNFRRRSSNLSSDNNTPATGSSGANLRSGSFRVAGSSSHVRTLSEDGGGGGQSSSRGAIRSSNSFGYSVADLVAYSVTGTPILTSLPFAVGSLASSSASIQELTSRGTPVTMQSDVASLRARFLQGGDGLASSSPPFPVVTMSAGSLMVSRHSSALALLEVGNGTASNTNTPLYSPSPLLMGTTPPPPNAQQVQNKIPLQVYEAALPWVLTNAEMDKPFSSLAGSLTLGVALEEPQVTSKEKKRTSRRDEEEALGLDDELTLPFMADEDQEVSLEDGSALGAFVRRCKEGKDILEASKTIKIEDVRKQLDTLMKQSGLDKLAQPQEVVTVYEERPL